MTKKTYFVLSVKHTLQTSHIWGFYTLTSDETFNMWGFFTLAHSQGWRVVQQKWIPSKKGQVGFVEVESIVLVWHHTTLMSWVTSNFVPANTIGKGENPSPKSQIKRLLLSPFPVLKALPLQNKSSSHPFSLLKERKTIWQTSIVQPKWILQKKENLTSCTFHHWSPTWLLSTLSQA